MELEPVEGDPFGIKLEPVEGNPFELGLKSDEGSMRGVTGNVGAHADWKKFEQKARPSTNVEDARKPQDSSLYGTLSRASEWLHSGISNALESAAQYGEPQGDPFAADPYTAAEPPSGYKDPYGKVLTEAGRGMIRHSKKPGEVARGVAPTTPGVMTEEDAFRINQLEGEAQTWGLAQALNTLGRGASFAERGALGVAGRADHHAVRTEPVSHVPEFEE